MEIKNELCQSITKVHWHISLDGWTIPHRSMNVLGLVMHITNSLRVRLNPVIGVHEIDSAHTCDSLATIVMEILEQ